MTVPTTSGSALTWRILAKKRKSATQGIPAGTEALQWVSNTVTLICGDRDAVLVDTFLSAEQTRELADWIAASGKNLTAIYVTHAHGDHFFGIGMLEVRFPGAHVHTST
jgi:glyoxylase-like metal-dependent hydrolase (beta-lactamase superfamily II)